MTTTEYDAAGHVQAVIDASGNRTDFRYNALGSVIEEFDAAANKTTTSYTLWAGRNSVTDRMGRILGEFGYDELNRRRDEYWFVLAARIWT